MRSTILLLLPVLCANAQAPVQTKIQAEIQRVRQSLADKPLTDADFAGVTTEVTQRSQTALDAAGAGRFYLALERLGQVMDMAAGARTAADLAPSVSDSLAAFEKEWAKSGADLDTFRKEFAARNWSAAPAAVRALAEAAASRTGPLLDGSRGFALTTKPGDGLFYLGQVRGQADFARFAAALELPRKGRAPPLRSLLPDLTALQQKTYAAFQPPRSIDQHPLFIALNSTLKLAQELDATKRYAGALYQYLEAARLYQMLDAQPPDAAAQAALRQTLNTQREKLAASPQDDSIAQLFLERALFQSQHPDGSASSPDEWRAASAIAAAILPAYRTALRPSAGPRPPHGRTIDITLVRWAYT